MYALIEKATNNILRLSPEFFELSPEKPFAWILCPDTTNLQSKYDGANFHDKPSGFYDWNGSAWVLNQAAQDAYDASVAQSQADELATQDTKAEALTQFIATHTPAECEQYVHNQVNASAVTDLASAKAALVKLENIQAKTAKILSVLARRELR